MQCSASIQSLLFHVYADTRLDDRPLNGSVNAITAHKQSTIKMMDDVFFRTNSAVLVSVFHSIGAFYVSAWIRWKRRRNLWYTLLIWVKWRCGARGPEHARQFPYSRSERTECSTFTCISKWEGRDSQENHSNFKTESELAFYRELFTMRPLRRVTRPSAALLLIILLGNKR